MIKRTREQIRQRAELILGESRLGALDGNGLVVISRDELDVLDRAYENMKEVQGRCTELLEEARAARRDARVMHSLAVAAGNALVDVSDIGAPEPG